MSQSITHYDSPIGAIEIHATDTAVSRVEFVGELSAERFCHTQYAAMQLQVRRARIRFWRRCRANWPPISPAHLHRFDLPLALDGTPFQRQVWQQLLSVAYGETASYQAIADAIDNPKAVRAVGAANGRNPVAIIVPCHRVIGINRAGSGARPKAHRLRRRPLAQRMAPAP